MLSHAELSLTRACRCCACAPQLLALRERLWEGYLLGAFGEYIVADIIEANFTACALDSTGCIELKAFEEDAFGIGATPPVEEEEGAVAGIATG